MDYFASIEVTNPAVYNHPYQYLHALFEWCTKQEYLPYNPFDKLDLKKIKDEENIMPAEIKEIQALLESLDKDDNTLDFTWQSRVPTGLLSPLLETQNQRNLQSL